MVRAAEMSKGELAALVFERLEQRHSLSEIVIALRIPPEDVRELYHTWLVGLWAGSCRGKSQPSGAAHRSGRDSARRARQLAQLLAALPSNQSTRIIIARLIGEFIISEAPPQRRSSSIATSASWAASTRSGPMQSRISWRASAQASTGDAYGFEPRGLRWEVFVRVEEEPL